MLAPLQGRLRGTLTGISWAWAFGQGEGRVVVSAPVHPHSFPGSLWADDGVGKQGWPSCPAGYL